MFQGVYTALVTPFSNGEIDFSSLDNLVKDQLAKGIQGFVVCGTTAESPCLSEKEKLSILDRVVELVGGKVPILFGSGSNNTSATIALSKKACERNIDGLLVVVPYYNKPPQEGLIAHFEAVANAVDKPIVLYNVPGRTVVSMEPETVITLSKHPNIVGIKEANADLNNFSKYKNSVGEDFSLLSGDDESCVSFCFLGGHGVISVCSHVAPAQMVEWISRGREKDDSVRDVFREQQRWIEKLYLTANPIPVKAALKHQKVIADDEVRLPLVKMPSELEEKMVNSLKEFKGLL